ncbi:MAG: Protein traM [Pseudomonadota bacterium]|jgi:hypothetical protein
MPADKLEETIREIAARHGIAVGRDDPILVLHTLNERLLQDSAAAQQDLLERFQQELENLRHRWVVDARLQADKTLQSAMATSLDAMQAMQQDVAAAAGQGIRLEIEALMSRLEASGRESRRVALMNLVASCVTVLAAGLVLWSAR